MFKLLYISVNLTNDDLMRQKVDTKQKAELFEEPKEDSTVVVVACCCCCCWWRLCAPGDAAAAPPSDPSAARSISSSSRGRGCTCTAGAGVAPTTTGADIRRGFNGVVVNRPGFTHPPVASVTATRGPTRRGTRPGVRPGERLTSGRPSGRARCRWRHGRACDQMLGAKQACQLSLLGTLCVGYPRGCRLRTVR